MRAGHRVYLLRSGRMCAAGPNDSNVGYVASAIESLDGGLAQDNFFSAQLNDRVAYRDFEGIAVHADEGPRLIAHIGDRQAVILRNHGLPAWGATFAVLRTLNHACKIQWAKRSTGRALPVSDEVARRSSRDALQFDPRHGAGQDVFDALVRKVDRIGTG